ncbi:TetR/AcrR family transcriptional regulator [Paraconexibacter antarcticus]|uniref:TetR/AcrR family transcriptional regulator n=1 Tax=Paraconexibacter antarcticus TaxID=2949664 RepID=A0ABY5DQM5_9ACTN|nr:TetR family transcriptional regulator [Paraconexibacter antarcticus]UTI63211.1 TetR/AcrR family transcriptional regulator [Paraconexibacter antarcticus]
MKVPHEVAWADLDASSKRERLLAAARELFSREGLGASMPALAAAAGAGVGSVYRQFADKDDLVAALVVQRLTEVGETIRAVPATGDGFADLTAMIWAVIDAKDGCDEIMIEAIAVTGSRRDVIDARALVAHAMDDVMDRARVQGTLRPDAEVQDLRLLFTAVRAAEAHATGGGRRIALLLIDGLRAGLERESA